ncbi:hypothetical protein V502_03283, partial [Pseudogymnoascus sp. VKM F-4520 (FW-2644)]
MAYIFNQTADVAQKHLAPRYCKGPDLFTSAIGMIDYLAEILQNPFELQDACIDFRKLNMKEDETFAVFYTCFLHLAGIGNIPTDDLQLDLYDKLTPALQQATAKLMTRSVAAPTGTRPPVTTSTAPFAACTASPNLAPKLYGLSREPTPVCKDLGETCYRCSQAGHFAKECSKAPAS